MSLHAAYDNLYIDLERYYVMQRYNDVISSFRCTTSYAFFFFFFNDPPPTEISTLSLHDALPIYPEPAVELVVAVGPAQPPVDAAGQRVAVVEGGQRRSRRHVATHARERHAHHGGRGAEFLRSEEHTSELQSPCNLVCRLLLEKKK